MADVNLVVALRAEAEPLIERFGLVPRRSGAFPTFDSAPGDARSLRLVISGVGAIRAAAAVGYAHGLQEEAGIGAWLNVGIAGHRDLELGEVRAVHRVTDAVTGRRWYPIHAFDPTTPTADLETVPVPRSDYAPDTLYDMEGAGFVDTAQRLSTVESVHAIKVVSDSARAPLRERPRPEQVAAAIRGALPAIEATVAALSEQVTERSRRSLAPSALDRWLERYRFTVTQRHQLRDLLRRWALALPERDPTESWATARDGREVLTLLRSRLDDAAPSLRATGARR